MPQDDYFYEGSWRVIVMIRPRHDATSIHEVPGPYMALERAEEHLQSLRQQLHTGDNVDLPWLALNGNELVGAYLAS
jgi:hypothetical protein